MTPQHSHRRTLLSARTLATGAMPMLAFALLCLCAGPAAADFRLCNNTSSRVGIALGYKAADGWTTEGWWNVSSRACETLLRVKVLAPVGPASSDGAMIRRLFEAGADVFRINMRHTAHDKVREWVATIRNVEGSYGRPIGILVDLQGPKLRLGSFAEGSVQF